jgi:hypothetical protein
MSCLSVLGPANENVGELKENLKLQNAIILKLKNTERKKFILLTYSSLGLPSFIENQGSHVNCCVDVT